MALTPLAVPAYPNVPLLPGVPPLKRDVLAAVAAAVAALTADSLSVVTRLPPARWGLFTRTGVLALNADSVLAFDYRKDYAIATYPVEGGGFQSYDKVEKPFDIRLSLTKGGSESDRAQFLTEVERIVAGIELYTVVTPEAIYDGVNPVAYDQRRSARGGATLLQIDLLLSQVRETARSAFTNTRQPQDGAVQDIGAVLPAMPTDAQAAVLTGAG